jgi:hypothetical protein
MTEAKKYADPKVWGPDDKMTESEAFACLLDHIPWTNSTQADAVRAALLGNDDPAAKSDEPEDVTAEPSRVRDHEDAPVNPDELRRELDRLRAENDELRAERDR